MELNQQIPSGTFKARALTWRWRESQKKNWFIQITFRITGPDHIGERVTGMLHFTNDDQAKRSYAALRAMGWTGEDAAECHDDNGGLDANEVEILVEHEEYAGRILPKVSRINPPATSINRAVLREFLRARIAPPPAAPAAPAAPATYVAPVGPATYVAPATPAVPKGSGNID